MSYSIFFDGGDGGNICISTINEWFIDSSPVAFRCSQQNFPWSSSSNSNIQRWVVAKARLQQQKLLKRPFANLPLCIFSVLITFSYIFSSLEVGNSQQGFSTDSQRAAEIQRLFFSEFLRSVALQPPMCGGQLKRSFDPKKQFLSCLVSMLLFWAFVRCEFWRGLPESLVIKDRLHTDDSAKTVEWLRFLRFLFICLSWLVANTLAEMDEDIESTMPNVVVGQNPYQWSCGGFW